MIRTLLIAILVLLSFAEGWATHVIGGNFNVVQTGRNQFYIDLIIFRDCRTGVPNPPVQLADSLWVRVFDQSDFNVFFDLQVKKDTPLTPQLGDDCFEPPNLCVEEYHLADTLFLPDNAAGYIVAMQICCRNFIIDNIVNPWSNRHDGYCRNSGSCHRRRKFYSTDGLLPRQWLFVPFCPTKSGSLGHRPRW